MLIEPAAAVGQGLGFDPQPAAAAGQPTLQLLFVHQPADPVPEPGPQDCADQPRQHGGDQAQLALVHQKARQRHHHLGRDRRDHVLEQHYQGDGSVPQQGIGLDCLADQGRQSIDERRQGHQAVAGGPGPASAWRCRCQC